MIKQCGQKAPTVSLSVSLVVIRLLIMRGCGQSRCNGAALKLSLTPSSGAYRAVCISVSTLQLVKSQLTSPSLPHMGSWRV